MQEETFAGLVTPFNKVGRKDIKYVLSVSCYWGNEQRTVFNTDTYNKTKWADTVLQKCLPHSKLLNTKQKHSQTLTRYMDYSSEHGPGRQKCILIHLSRPVHKLDTSLRIQN